MKAFAWLSLATLVGCAGIEAQGPGAVTGRITTDSRFGPPTFSFMDRTYVERSLRVDATGGVADAAIYLEGLPSPAWVSGRVRMNFTENQFEPRVSFVSPGEPLEIGDTRDDAKHELSVLLGGVRDAESTVFTKGSEPTRDGKPARVCFDCKDGRWTVSGKGHLQRGRTKDLVFGQPVMVPIEWD